MKLNVALLGGCLAMAGAVQLRGADQTDEVPKTLLKRCTSDGVTPQQCCHFTKKSHPLYKSDNVYDFSSLLETGRNPVCCNQGIGMWVPTNDRNEHNKFCRTKSKEDSSKANLDVVNTLTGKFQHTLDALISTKDDLKKEFKKLYIAHEKEENEADAKNKQKEREIQLEENKVAEKKVELKGLKYTLRDVRRQQSENREKMRGLVADSLEKVDDAKKELEKYQKDVEKKEKDVEKAIKVLEECMGDNKKKQKELEKLKNDLRVARAKVKVTRDLLKERQTEFKELKASQTEQANALAEQLRGAEEEEKAFQQTYEESRKSLLEAQSEFKAAQAKANEMLLADPALLETAQSGNTEEVKICDEECEEMKKWTVDDYLSGELNDSKNLLSKATNYVDKQMKNMHSMFHLLKQTQKRVSKLKKLDEDLNKKIMADITRENTRLGEKLKRVQKYMKRLVRSAENLENKIERVQEGMVQYTETMEKKALKNTKKLVKLNQQIESAMSSLVVVQGELTRTTASQAECMEAASKLKKDSKTAVDATNVANNDAERVDGKLKSVEQSILDLRVKGEAAKVLAEGKIKTSQENLESLKIKADLNDDKTKRLKKATAGLEAATAF